MAVSDYFKCRIFPLNNTRIWQLINALGQCRHHHVWIIVSKYLFQFVITACKDYAMYAKCLIYKNCLELFKVKFYKGVSNAVKCFFLQSGQLFEVFKNHSRMHFLWKVCPHINFILSLHFPNWQEQITHFPISFKLAIFLKTQPILWWFMFRTRFLNARFLSRGHSKQMTHFGLWISIVFKYSRIIQKIHIMENYKHILSILQVMTHCFHFREISKGNTRNY